MIQEYQYVEADASLDSPLDPSGSGLVACNDQSLKRKDNESDCHNNNRFKDITKWLKTVEVRDPSVDSVLAETVYDLVLKGLDDEHYSRLVQDENNARPENCEEFTVV